MKDYLARLGRPDPRLLLAALFAIAILHVAATFAASRVALSPAYDALASALKPNTMVVLPPVTPEAQLLPYLAPDARLALCRFDTARNKVAVTATLPGPGWTLTLYDPDGIATYTAVGQPDRQTELSLLLVPDDDRFTGLTPEARGERSRVEPLLRVQAHRGLAVLRAPDSGLGFRARDEAWLKRATCRARDVT